MSNSCSSGAVICWTPRAAAGMVGVSNGACEIAESKMDNSNYPKRRPGPIEGAVCWIGFFLILVAVGAVTDLLFF